MQKQLSDIYEWFNGNPAFNIITLLLAIIGIVLSFYFYFKSKKNKIPIYIARSINLVRESIKKIETVEILYAGNKIENLSITKVAIWNDGRDTISFVDVAHADPLKICIDKEYDILDAEILFQRNSANDFNLLISNDKKSVLIKFDFFDFEEGVIIQLAHTGNSSDDIKLLGTIKSVKKILRKSLLNSIFPRISTFLKISGDSKVKRRTVLNVIGLTVTLVGVFIFSLPLILPKLPSGVINPPDGERSSFFKYLPFSLTGLLYVWTGVRFLKRRIPKGFDIFDEEF